MQRTLTSLLTSESVGLTLRFLPRLLAFGGRPRGFGCCCGCCNPGGGGGSGDAPSLPPVESSRGRVGDGKVPKVSQALTGRVKGFCFIAHAG